MHFGCYGNLKFPLTYNGINENGDLFQIFWQKFYRNVVEMSSTKHIILVQTSQFVWLPW